MALGYQRPWVRASWILGFLGLFLAFSAGRSLAVDYSYETDPIRLGMKAIEEGRLDDARKNFQEALDNNYETYKAHYGMGEILRREGSYADAEASYREALDAMQKEKGSTEFPECHAGLGLDLLRLGRTAEAEQELQTALDQKGGLWEAQYGMARVEIGKGNYDAALKLLDKGKKKKGLKEGEDLYHYGMGLALYGKGELDLAEKEALKAQLLNPNDPEYGTLVAQVYTKKGALPLAIQAYETALAQPGARPNARTLTSLGKLYQDEMYQMYKEGNRSEQLRLGGEALKKYKEAVLMDSTYAPAWKDMGHLYSMADRFDEAAGAYLRYAELNPDDPEAMLGLAEACMKGKVKRYAQAKAAAEKAYSLDSTNVETRLTLARALFVNQEKERALRLYATVNDTTKFGAEDYLRMGQAKADGDDLKGAKKDLQKALDWDSTLAEAWYALGQIDLKQSDSEGALANFRKASTLDPENPTIRLNLGVTYLRLQRNGDAIHQLRKAVTLVPGVALPRIYLASALMTADSTGAAMEQYVKAREMDPNNASIYRGLGLGYLKRSDYDRAIEALQKATELDPGNADGWAWLGQGYAMKNQFQKAKELLKKALAINPDHTTAKKLLDILEKQTPAAKQ